jgi:hypothetical protein
VVYSF